MKQITIYRCGYDVITIIDGIVYTKKVWEQNY